MPVDLNFAATNLLAYIQNPAVAIVAHLAKNPIAAVNGNILLAAFVECDFDGYEPIPITDWEIVDAEEDDYAEALSPQLEWIAGDFIEPQQIYGVYVTATEGANPPVLICAAILPNPLVLDTPGAMIPYQIRAANSEIPA